MIKSDRASEDPKGNVLLLKRSNLKIGSKYGGQKSHKKKQINISSMICDGYSNSFMDFVPDHE